MRKREDNIIGQRLLINRLMHMKSAVFPSSGFLSEISLVPKCFTDIKSVRNIQR